MNTNHLFPDYIQITDQTNLKILILRLKKSINDGSIEQIWPADATFATETKVLDVNETGPWPADYIEWYFLSNVDKAVYQLTVETYHGTGGHWKKIV